MMYGFRYRGKHSRELGIVSKTITRPVIAPVRIEEKKVPYRNGTLDYSEHDGQLYYDDKLVELELVLITPELRQTQTKVSDVVRWLAGSWGDLIFDDMPNTRWIAKPIDISSIEIELFRIGRTKVQFRAKPFNTDTFTVDGVPLDSFVPLNSALPIGYGDDNVIDVTKMTTNAMFYYEGDVPVYPVMRVDGFKTELTISTNDAPTIFRISLGKACSEYGGVIIDCEKQEVIGVDGTVLTEKSAGNFFEFMPGENKWTIQSDNKSSGKITLLFYNQYYYGGKFDAESI